MGKSRKRIKWKLLLGRGLRVKKNMKLAVASEDVWSGSRLAEQLLQWVAEPIRSIPGTDMEKTEEAGGILSSLFESIASSICYSLETYFTVAKSQ